MSKIRMIRPTTPQTTAMIIIAVVDKPFLEFGDCPFCEAVCVRGSSEPKGDVDEPDLQV